MENLLIQKGPPTCFLKKFSIFAGWEIVSSSVVKTGTSPINQKTFYTQEGISISFEEIPVPLKLHQSHLEEEKNE